MSKETVGEIQDLKLRCSLQVIPELGKMRVMIWRFELPPQDKLGSCTHALLIDNQQTYHEVHVTIFSNKNKRNMLHLLWHF